VVKKSEKRCVVAAETETETERGRCRERDNRQNRSTRIKPQLMFTFLTKATKSLPCQQSKMSCACLFLVLALNLMHIILANDVYNARGLRRALKLSSHRSCGTCCAQRQSLLVLSRYRFRSRSRSCSCCHSHSGLDSVWLQNGLISISPGCLCNEVSN